MSVRPIAATRAAVAVVLALLVLSSVPPTPAAPATQATPVPKGRFAVGDSVMLAAKPSLEMHGYRVDAVVGRQFSAARPILAARGAALPRVVIIHLGTNGPIPLAECRALVRLAGPQRRVIFATTQLPPATRYAYERSNKAVLRACARAFRPGRAFVIDWQAFSDARPWLMCTDGMHIACGGANAYSRFVRSNVRRIVHSVPW